MTNLVGTVSVLLDNLEASEEFVQSLKRISEDLDVEEARNRRLSVIGREDIEGAVAGALDTAKEQASDVLVKEIKQALTISDEFSDIVFSIPLMTVARTPELISIIPAGAGFETSVIVDIRMDEIAGTLDDYSNAVQLVRDAEGYNQDDPIRASIIWKKVIYPDPAKHKATIRARLAAAGKKAPFWALLNYGSSAKMSSSYGGFPYPEGVATHFVEEAIGGIREVFKSALLSKKESLYSQQKRAKENLELIKRLRVRIEESLNKISIARKVALASARDPLRVSVEKIHKATLELESTKKKSLEIGIPGFRSRITPSRLRRILYED